MSNPYETLGVPKDASAEDIKKAFKRKAHDTHPDRDGGDAEAFKEIGSAYALLSDHSRRERYDSHGEQGVRDENAKMLEHLAGLMFSLIDNIPDVHHVDILDVMRQNISQSIVKAYQERTNIERSIEKRKTVLKRLSKKKRKKGEAKGQSMLFLMLQNDIDKREQGLKNMEEAVERTRKLLKLLDDYNYEVLEQVMVTMHHSHFTTTSTFR